jgi:uncharacterized lipoprotein YddW (UPF0748 family)
MSQHSRRLFLSRSLSAAASTLAVGCGIPAAAQAILPRANPEGVAREVLRHSGLQGRVLWWDGTANLERLCTPERVRSVMDRCVRARINTIVVDVKPLSGHVLYHSRVAPRLSEWRGFAYPEGHDLLRVALHEGHARNLKIYANINVFSDGHKLVKSGPIYGRPEQQSVIYDVQRTLTAATGEQFTLAVGVNRTPEPGQMTVYDPSFRAVRPIGNSDVFALLVSDTVAMVGDAAAAPRDGVRIPSDGALIVAKGEAGRWLIENLQPGDVVSWSARSRLIPIVDAPSETIAAFFNPAHPASRAYLLEVVDEIATRYPVDGIVFDRMRYASLQSDFSPLSRQMFEEALGIRLGRFPEDVMAFDAAPGKPIRRGPYFREWLEWRARNIRTWLEQAAGIVRARRPEAKVAAYVGSWYGSYYTVGVNWGSMDFSPNYDWMGRTYPSTGYAHLLDWITTGCYHPVATREQALLAGLDDSYTVQASAELSTRAVADDSFVYAGLYVLDYKESPEAFRLALRSACDHSHGVMLFDLSQLDDYRWWPVLEEEFEQPRVAPHDVNGLLSAVRTMRKSLDRASRPSLP